MKWERIEDDYVYYRAETKNQLFSLTVFPEEGKSGKWQAAVNDAFPNEIVIGKLLMDSPDAAKAYAEELLSEFLGLLVAEIWGGNSPRFVQLVSHQGQLLGLTELGSIYVIDERGHCQPIRQ